MSKRPHCLSLKEKYDVIRLIDSEKKSFKYVTEKFKCGKTQIYNIMQNKEKLKKKYLCSTESEKDGKKSRSCTYETLNMLTFEWFCKARAKNIPISGPILQEAALNIGRELKIDEFKASNGWLSSFRSRYNITFNIACGESNEVNSRTVEEWKGKLRRIIENYNIKDIANADETALFYKALPNRTLHLKGQKCPHGKLSKERLTLLLIVFADGTIEKSAVIGKSHNPRCFKNLKKSSLPVSYYNNSTAWMSSEIFQTVITQLNAKMRSQRRNILLFVDNAACHPHLTFSNIKLIYLPPNTTSVLQPLDNGIIQAVKIYYRKLMLKDLLSKIEDGNTGLALTKKISILDAIIFLDAAIKCVKPTTIQKCFKNCGFPVNLNEETYEESEQGVVEIQNLIGAIYNDHLHSAINFVNMDVETVTESSSIDIVELVQQNTSEGELVENNLNSDDVDDDDDDDDDIENVPNKSEMMKSLKNLETFAKHKDDSIMFAKICELKLHYLELMKVEPKLIQSTLQSYFTPVIDEA